MDKEKQITALYFGLLGERRGLQSEVLRTTAATPRTLFAEISATHCLGISTEHLRVAVNDEFVEWDHPLASGQTVAFLPPMSGG